MFMQSLNSEIPSKVRARLGSAGFAADTMDLQVKRLSGGQKARLLLLLVVIEKPDLLILDEPTNHLDIESREALIMALNDYSGSLILVSHDAFLVERLVDRLLIVKNGGVSEFSGDIHEYRDLVLNKNQNQKKNNKKNIRINSTNNFNSTSSLSDLKKRLSVSEKKMNEYEKKKSDLENEMLDNQFYDIKNTLRIKEVNTDLKKNLQLLKQEEKVWEKIAEDIENFDK